MLFMQLMDPNVPAEGGLPRSSKQPRELRGKGEEEPGRSSKTSSDGGLLSSGEDAVDMAEDLHLDHGEQPLPADASADLEDPVRQKPPSAAAGPLWNPQISFLCRFQAEAEVDAPPKHRSASSSGFDSGTDVRFSGLRFVRFRLCVRSQPCVSADV